MNNISSIYGKKALAGFVTAGDPNLKASEEIVLNMIKGGCDLAIIGIPFSDPIAEDIVVQSANIRALQNGVLTNEVFEMVKNITNKTDAPIILKSYLNVLFKFGYDNFFKTASECKVAGVIVPDMPFEEMAEVEEIAKKYDVNVISIISSSSEERIKRICKKANGFVCEFLSPDDFKNEENTTNSIKIAKENTSLPIFVNYDAKNADEINKYLKTADGVIISTEIVRIIENEKDNAPKAVFDFIKTLKNNIIK